MIIKDDTKEWFCIQSQNDPAFLANVYFPAVERDVEKARQQRDQANRSGTTEQIKYAQGLLDGVELILKIINGIKSSREQKAPPEQGSIARMLTGYWNRRKNGD